ncbi:NYN domain-containing protein [Nocardia jiangxiensis]|uniref:NYN domain-containing protein n=1 Tax=Nocardia jiangxiensis TaxID=282685 RepID=A0ABW6S4T3_9NOCA
METEHVDDSVRMLVVDAANVVGSRPDGWWRDRAGAARRLLTGLAALREHLPHSCEVVVVLEGAAKAVDDNEFRNIRVVRAAGSGDDAIVAVTAEHGDHAQVLVVTADRGLRARIEALGARTTGPRRLLDRIDSAGNP